MLRSDFLSTNLIANCDCYILEPGVRDIFVVESKPTFSAVEFIQTHKDIIETVLLQYGAVLLRGFDINGVSEFNKVAQIITPNLLEYIYRSTPRTKLGGRIYTATEYPSNRHIPLHNEFSYFRFWPNKIMFFCVISPTSGGETPIADSRKVLKNINPEIVNKFKQKGVMYVRNYTSGIDLSWQEVFQTDSKEKVECYCDEHAIQWLWRNDSNELTTKQVCQATVNHPITGEEVWFNQAHLFHISSLVNEDAAFLKAELGEDNLTRNSFYGDGTNFEPPYLTEIRQAYDAATIKFEWQRGDIMLLDNILMAHGRTPYTGERKIAVAMG